MTGEECADGQKPAPGGKGRKRKGKGKGKGKGSKGKGKGTSEPPASAEAPKSSKAPKAAKSAAKSKPKPGGSKRPAAALEDPSPNPAAASGASKVAPKPKADRKRRVAAKKVEVPEVDPAEAEVGRAGKGLKCFARRRRPAGAFLALKWDSIRQAFQQKVMPLLTTYSAHEDCFFETCMHQMIYIVEMHSLMHCVH